MPLPTDILAAFRAPGHTCHWSVAPEIAPLVRCAIEHDHESTRVTVWLRRPATVLSAETIEQSSDGSTSVVVLFPSRRGLVALTVRYAATYALAQPSPFRAAVLENWVHVAPSDAFEAALALRLFLAASNSR